MISLISSLFPRLANISYTRPPVSKMSSSSSQHGPEPGNIIWVDMEMTGLDPEVCKVLEIACIVTDKELNVIKESPNIVIHQSDDVLNSMNEWCLKHHGESGLIEKSRQSTYSEEKAESEILQFLSTCTKPGSCPLAGNSVYMDKIFMFKYLPNLASYFHYRIIDVSTVKELCRRWYPSEEKKLTKALKHRALDDIKESIEELRTYRKRIFK